MCCNCNRIFYAVNSKKPYRSHRAGIMSGINSVSLSAIQDKRGGVENLHPCHVIENSMQLKWGFIFFHKNTQSGFFKIVCFQTTKVRLSVERISTGVQQMGEKSPCLARIWTNELISFQLGVAYHRKSNIDKAWLHL